MFNRRFTHYIIAVGILVLLSALYLGYRAYQNHVDFGEFMSRAVSFRQSLDKDTQPGVDSTDSQNIQSRGDAVSLTSGLAPNQTEYLNTHGDESSSPPVKVRIMTPKEVALYSDGDPHAAVRVESQHRPPVPDRTWTNDEHVSQWVELPDGELVKIITIPGMEIREGDRVSLQYIENAKDNRGRYIEIDGERYDFPPEPTDDEYAREYVLQKSVWAETLKTSVQEVEQMITNRELIVKLSHETMTPEETEINLNLLSAVRPDLYEAVQPLSVSSEIKTGEVEEWLNSASSVSSEIKTGEVEEWFNSASSELLLPGEVNSLLLHRSDFPPVSSVSSEIKTGEVEEWLNSASSVSSEIKTGEVEEWFNSASSELLLPGEVNSLLLHRSDFPPVSSQKTADHDGLSAAPADKAQQLIDRYGTEEGLRRLRESDPEAAERFESDKSRPGRERRPSRDAPKRDGYSDEEPPDDSR